MKKTTGPKEEAMNKAFALRNRMFVMALAGTLALGGVGFALSRRDGRANLRAITASTHRTKGAEPSASPTTVSPTQPRSRPGQTAMQFDQLMMPDGQLFGDWASEAMGQLDLAATSGSGSGEAELAAGPELSTISQQTLATILAGLPDEIGQMTLRAVQALGPRANPALEQAASLSQSPEVQALVQLAIQIVESLPADARQPFVDGLWGVSPAEEEFAREVLEAIIQANNEDSLLAARLHETTIGVGQAWACSLGGGSVVYGASSPFIACIP